MFEVSFSRASRLNSFFLWFLPSNVGPLVYVSFLKGEICAEFLFVCLFVCLFFLLWARPSEVVILSADDWVCIFVLFVV